MDIYVEIPILCAVDELWEKTQNPALHQRWDLRFTEIEYLPRTGEEPQEFLYRTRIGLGIKIDGKGESTGTKDGEGGTRTSSLKFWSDDPKSLIKMGSEYWKYVPTRTGSAFLLGTTTKHVSAHSEGPWIGACSVLSWVGRLRGASIGYVCGLSAAYLRKSLAIECSPIRLRVRLLHSLGSTTACFRSFCVMTRLSSIWSGGSERPHLD